MAKATIITKEEETKATVKQGGNSALLQTLLIRHGKMVTQRSTYLPMWQELADRLMPDQSEVIRAYMPGGKRTQFMFDATAPLALKKYADAKESMICPATARWHGLQDANADLNEIPEVQEYYEKVTDLLFKTRYAKGTNFTQNANECFINDGCYGNFAMFIDDCYGRGIRYRSLHIKEMYYAENFCGNVDLLHREFKMSNKQAYERFDGNLPPSIKKAYEDGDWFTEYKYVHMVHPNPDFREGAVGLNGLKFLSHYVCWDEQWLCRTGNGYRSFPYAVGRFMTIPGEVYGRGPASLVLPDIKQVNEMEKVNLRQGQLSADPPNLMYEDGNLSGFNMQPGAFIWGGLNKDGKEMAKPYLTGVNFQVSLEMQEKKRALINEAFYVTLFQILVQTPQMTATEALLRAQEKAQLLMPTMGRTQTEWATAVVEREIEILDSAGVLPPKPAVMLEESHGAQPEYVSPLNRAQQAEEGVAIMHTLQSAAVVTEFDPSTPLLFKGKGPKIMRKLAKANGMHVELMNTDDEIAQLQQSMAKQQQMQTLLAAAQPASEAAKNFAQAQATAGQGAAPTAAPVVLPS